MKTPVLPQIPIIKSVTDLRYQARDIVHRVMEGNTVLLTRDSDPVAVLFPVHLYESIRRYIEDTQDVIAIKKVLAQKEPSVDFSTFDATMRKKHNLPSHVSHNSAK